MRPGRKYRKVPFIVLLYGLALVFLYNYSIRVEYIKKPLSIELDKCSCRRNLTTYNLNITRTFFNYTTCGRDAFFRGPHQKVIAFSFYGNSSYPEHLVRGFFEGIRGNVKLINTLYNQSWVMRLYYDIHQDDEMMDTLCDIACEYDNLDLCYVRELPGTPDMDVSEMFPMNWRFLPSLDPQVDIMMSRDLDSRISLREAAAVQEWLDSGAPIHSMRDHPSHSFSMLGGMWGARLEDVNIRRLWAGHWDRMLEDKLTFAPRKRWGPDQDLLNKHVWPWARYLAFEHDSYQCGQYPDAVGFPTQRLNETRNFVGFKYNEENYSMLDICPTNCRRNESWVFC